MSQLQELSFSEGSTLTMSATVEQASCHASSSLVRCSKRLLVCTLPLSLSQRFQTNWQHSSSCTVCTRGAPKSAKDKIASRKVATSESKELDLLFSKVYLKCRTALSTWKSLRSAKFHSHRTLRTAVRVAPPTFISRSRLTTCPPLTWAVKFSAKREHLQLSNKIFLHFSKQTKKHKTRKTQTQTIKQHHSARSSTLQ